MAPAQIKNLLDSLSAMKRVFTGESAKNKLELLTRLSELPITRATDLKCYHSLLLFFKAFPDSSETLRLVTAELRFFGERVNSINVYEKEQLDCSGIDGTEVLFEYSFEAANYLSKRFPESINFYWEAFESPGDLDELNYLFSCPLEEPIFSAEEQVFPGERPDTRSWLIKAKGSSEKTELSWFFSQLRAGRHNENTLESLYRTANPPLQWKLDRPGSSISTQILSKKKIHFRNSAYRSTPKDPVKFVKSKFSKIRLLKNTEAKKVIDLCYLALASRQREVRALSFHNPQEVYLADLGLGAELAILGTRPKNRLTLEANYGYVILSNGVPVGYGGVSPLLFQANTGVNIFEQFRGSEAGFLFCSTLRVFRELFKTRYFVVNPYQFGRDNEEAIESGAFWFYYRLGFRPKSAALRKLANQEYARLLKNRKRRTSPNLLRRLAQDDLVLDTGSDRTNLLFEDNWIGVLAEETTRLLGNLGPTLRKDAISECSKLVARTLGIRSNRSWSKQQKSGFTSYSPLAAFVLDDIKGWPKSQKQKLKKLMLSKGAEREADYAICAANHKRFFLALKKFCRKKCSA